MNNPLTYFLWYRKWRGGWWGKHSSLIPFVPHAWTRFVLKPDDFSTFLGDEHHRDFEIAE